jgi:CubicO group peptidase (beta-lactamase class C family)
MYRRTTRWLAVVLGCLSWAACTEDSPQASSEQLARAERLYTQCVEEELGLELHELKLSPGNIVVRFAPGTSAEDEARAIEICEPRIAFVLEPGAPDLLGPPKNLGRPASDTQLAELVRARAKLGFEGAVLIESAGQRRLQRGEGRVRPSASSAPTLSTAFDCGSIMKEVTAALIFLLEEEGALSRSQTLGELFDDAPASWRAVTLDQVLGHQAGFHAYHDTEGDFEPMDRAGARAAIFAQQPLFPPGTDSSYSNAGYTLLALVIEQVTSSDYRDVARDRIFRPLGMQRSGFYGDALWADGNVAIGRGADQFEANDPARWPEPSWALMGNGGLVSTVEDLLRMAKAFDDDSLFRPLTREAFWANQPPGQIDGRAFYAYAGGNDFGFQVVVAHIPEDQSYIVVASHVLATVTAELLAVELLQTTYGAVAKLPTQD